MTCKCGLCVQYGCPCADENGDLTRCFCEECGCNPKRSAACWDGMVEDYHGA